MREDTVEVTGTVIECLPKAIFRVELSNGHCIIGYVPVKNRGDFDGLEIGDKVTLLVSPFDFSKGKIIGKRKGLK